MHEKTAHFIQYTFKHLYPKICAQKAVEAKPEKMRLLDEAPAFSQDSILICKGGNQVSVTW